MKRLLILGLVFALIACAGNSEVEGERVTVDDGVVSVCGEGDGLPECRDFNGETYSEELKYKTPTDEQMEQEAAKVREESPEELEKTISEMESNPGEYWTK
ncbi:MAG: hypothetical protein H6991_03910 [Pseudomonadales bacterium]|nr:hypothetical protein [Pseudomonadales bacterium]